MDVSIDCWCVMFQAVEADHIPSPVKLCGLIVDQQVKQNCLKCFAEAGELSKVRYTWLCTFVNLCSKLVKQNCS